MLAIRNITKTTTCSNVRYFYSSGKLQNFSFPPNRASNSKKGVSNSDGMFLSLDLTEPITRRDSVERMGKYMKGNNGSGGSSSDNIKVVEPRFLKQFNTESIYDPFDFSLARINLDRKFNENKKPLNKINPLDLYLYPEILSKYVSSTGRILHRDVTGLSPRDQRLISKAIRRCQAIGLMSKTSNNYNR